MKVEFTVPGIPVGKGRPRFMKNGHTYTPQKTRDYEDKVVQCWQCQSGKGFAAGVPLRATVTAFFTVPKSTSKKKAAALDGAPHTKRPDADNVAKAILDALKAVNLPAAEVHISDVTKREPFRQISYAGMACQVHVIGQGIAGYVQAAAQLQALIEQQ